MWSALLVPRSQAVHVGGAEREDGGGRIRARDPLAVTRTKSNDTVAPVIQYMVTQKALPSNFWRIQVHFVTEMGALGFTKACLLKNSHDKTIPGRDILYTPQTHTLRTASAQPLPRLDNPLTSFQMGTEDLRASMAY